MFKWIVGFAFVLTGLLAGPTAHAETFIPTIYSDGYSCPGNCDAHVVFNSAHNGTKFASLPSSSRSNPEQCELGKPCRICFGDGDGTCMEAVYRGGGPAKGRFDFTPAYYEATCGKPGLPGTFAKLCASFNEVYAGYTQNAVYCLAEPAADGCPAVIRAAEDAKTADKPLWDECRSLGEKAFNKKYAQRPRLQRSDRCAYEKHGTGGPNSKGESWRKLLPAACQSGSYAGRNGLDCCDKNKMSLGGLGRECSVFLARKP